jgi:hypothetical protein
MQLSLMCHEILVFRCDLDQAHALYNQENFHAFLYLDHKCTPCTDKGDAVALLTY